ncbi:protein sidekick-1-like isoform X3 [Montipora foliosa]|uniref:protein sidekick-1-like isoform X3 n=1 Tax=Montipora foliosa TaxID=591990 RepID=UPI0035F1499E
MACTGFFLILAVLLSTTEAVPAVTINGAPEQFIIVGNEIQLTCHYNSTPAASEVQWQKNGLLISRNATMENGARGNITHFNESSIQLTINPSISTDAADYTCFVIKILDNSSDTIAIRAVPAVTINGAPEQFIIVGNEIQLTCHYDSTPAASEVRWQKNGLLISRNATMENGARGNITHFNESSIQLTINPSISTDAADYTCFVIKILDNSSDTIAIRVKPDPPQSVIIASKTSRTITISWKSGFDGNSEISSYTVEISEDNQNFSDGYCQGLSNSSCRVSGLTTNATLEGLHPGRMYYVRVFANNKVGQSEASSIVNATTDEEVPSAPPTSVQGHNLSSTSIFVSWGEVPPDDQNGVILSYTVTYRALPSGSEQMQNVTAPNTTATLTGLNEYTNYSITVFASTIKGGGNKSVPIVAITDEDIPSAPPTSVQGHNLSSTSIFVSWGEVPADDQNGVILSYTVTYKALPDGSEQTHHVTAPTTLATLTGLNEYTNYSITVFASTIKGGGPVSQPLIIITDQDVPSAPPTSVQGHNLSSTSIFVSWGEVPQDDQNGDILSYTVTYRALPSGSEQMENVTAPNTTASLTGLNEYTNYSITVFASTIKGAGNKSVPIVVITDEDKPNAPPRNVRKFNTTSTSIVVQWDQVPAADQNGVILSYTVTYQALPDGSEQTHQVNAPTTLATLTGLNGYTNYSITVFASTIKGGGPVSQPLIIITDQDAEPAVTINGAPEQFIIVGNEIQLTCHYNSTPAASEVRWQKNGLLISRNATMENGARGNITHFNESSIQLTISQSISTDAANYICFVIKILDNSSDTIAIRVKPDSPRNVTIESKTSRTITISWISGFDGNSEISSYTVEISEDNQNFGDGYCQGLSISSCRVSGLITNATLEGLHPGRMYYLRVFANNTVGQSEASSVVNATTDEEVKPDPPRNVTIESKTSRTITISWISGFDGNSEISSYTVEISEDNQNFGDGYCQGLSNTSCTVSGLITKATLEGLHPGRMYYLRVFANNTVGQSEASSVVNETTDEEVKPDSPRNVTIESKTSRTITISWISGFDGNSEISSYTVEISEDNQNFGDGYCQGLSNSSCIVSGLITKATLEGLHPGRKYYLRVFANNTVGQSQASSVVNETTAKEVKPDSPRNVTIESKTSRTITISWISGFDGNSEISSYTVEISEDNQNFGDGYCQRLSNSPCRVSGLITNATLEGLHPGRMYYLRVFANNAVGQSEASSVVNETADEEVPSAPPTSVQGYNTSSTSIFVSWGEVPVSDQNGVILSYTVTYHTLPSGPERTKTVSAPTTNITLGNLNEFTEYSITVFASTIKGGGTTSAAIVVRTDEDSPVPTLTPPRMPSVTEKEQAVEMSLTADEDFKWDFNTDKSFKDTMASVTSAYCESKRTECALRDQRRMRREDILYEPDQVHLLPGYPSNVSGSLQVAFYVQQPQGLFTGNTSVLPSNTLLQIVESSKSRLENAIGANITSVKVLPTTKVQESDDAGSSESSNLIAIGVSVAVSTLFVVVCIVIFVWRVKKKRARAEIQPGAQDSFQERQSEPVK